MTKIKPLMDRVLLKSLEKNMTLDSGIYVPESANTERPYIYEVIEVWPWTKDKTTDIVKIWDKVLVGQYSGDDVKVDETEYKIVAIEYILAVVE